MKEKNRLILIILIFLGIALLSFSDSFSIISGGNKINCGVNQNKFVCGTEGLGGVNFENIKINEPTNANEYAGSLCSILDSASSIQCRGQKFDEPSSDYRGYVSNLVDEKLGNKLLIIEGVYNQIPFKTYGLCLASHRSCPTRDPLPKISENINVTNINFYFKDGGYNENNICEFGFSCPGTINVYRFENDACMFKEILENQRQDNDFDTFAECEEYLPKPFPISTIIIILILGGGVIFLFKKTKWQK